MNFQSFIIKCDVISYELFINAAYHVEKVPFISHLVWFYLERMLDFINFYSASIDMTMGLLSSFILLMWCVTLTDVGMLNHPCLPGMHPLDYGAYSFHMLWALICWCFDEDFCIFIYKTYWYVFLFSFYVFDHE